MPIVKRVKRCKNCGTLLQTSSPDFPGYVSQEIMDQDNDDCLCKSCSESLKLKAHNEYSINDEYFELLSKMREKRFLIVYVVDIFSFEGSFISKVNESLKGCDVLAVGNKIDLLPNFNEEELNKYLAHRMRVAKLDVKDVVLTSTVTNRNIDVLFNKIKSMAQDRDVCFIGASVSGKTALIYSMLKEFENNTKEPVVTHTFKGTSLRGFKIPLGNGHYIYEAPGLPINNSLLAQVELLVGHLIVPEKQISPRALKIEKGSSLLLGGLAMFELIKGNTTKINLYCKQSVEAKITKEGEQTFGIVLYKHNLKPTSNLYKNFADFDVYDLEVVEEGSRDIGILGLGWISFKAQNQVFRIFVPKGVCIYTSRSKVDKWN